jgi:hypothetical protein
VSGSGRVYRRFGAITSHTHGAREGATPRRHVPAQGVWGSPAPDQELHLTRLSKNPEFQQTGIRKSFVFKEHFLWKIQKSDFFDSSNRGLQPMPYNAAEPPLPGAAETRH